MVFFTCNACGSSLKKNKVEKHYATQCRNAMVVSCMDCAKDFPGETYKAHTKCITEEEKYSAKGWQPKASQNKGEKKQQEWVELVNGILQSNENLPAQVKKLLDTVSGFDNIPRKKVKFQNFIKNVAKFANQSTVDQTWDLLEKAIQAKRNDKENQEKNGDGNAEENDETKVEENGTEHKLSKKERKELRRKEKHKAEKKDKRTEVESDEDAPKQKKRKHKESENGVEVEHESDNGEDTESVPKKKKKKKHEKGEIKEQDDEESALTNGEESAIISKKKKKKNVEQDAEVTVTSNGDESGPPKKKKNKRKKGEAEDEEPCSKKNKDDQVNGNAGEETEEKKEGKFHWERVIKTVLKAADDNEISLKRLQKKVLSEYQACGGDGKGAMSKEQLLAKLDKKLHKLPRVTVDKEKVKLAS